MVKNINPELSDRDKLVHVRNQMYVSIYKAINELNKGNRNPLATVLKTINNVYKHGFTVDTKPDKSINMFGTDFNKDDNLIIIKENGKDLMAIFKIRTGEYKGEYRVTELDPYAFETDEERDAEHEWEQQAERAMIEYYEGRNSHWMDDPRGN